MNAFLLVFLLILLAVITSYLAAVNLALYQYSPSGLERRLASKGRAGRAQWLTEHLDAATISVALLRTMARITFLLLLIAELLGVGANITVSWARLLIAGGIALAVFWIGNSVIGRAVARYASDQVIESALPWLRGLTFIFSPLSRAFSFIDEAVRRLTGAGPAADLIAADLIQRIEDSHIQGGLDEDAAEMLGNLVEFRSTDVGEIMTPRTDIEGIELTDDLNTIRDFIVKAGHSRIPVYEGDLDHIIGILYVKDLVPFLGCNSSTFKLRSLLRNPIRVPEMKALNELLQDFRRSEVHMAIVLDEYGGTAGLATIEDVLEEIVGEIHDEHEPDDEEQPELIEVDGTHAEVDGRFYVDDLNERLDLDLPEDEEFDTIAGFMMARLGHVPAEGETVETEQARFTAIACTQTHVQRIGIELIRGMHDNGNGRPDGESVAARAATESAK